MAQSQHATSSFHKPLPYLSPGQIKEICEAGETYISEQRSRFLGRGANLSRGQISRLSAFFRSDLLNSIRLFVLEDDRVPNPPFYPTLRAMGFASLPDFALMAAVTFKDVIVSYEACSEGVLFHELVHAEQYRQLGARARAMLIAAAAAQWKVTPAQCRAESSVVYGPNGQSARYAELAEAAAHLPVPENIQLKKESDLRLTNKEVRRLDSGAKCNGSQKFGLDVDLPGMKVALVAHPPVFGAKVKGFDANAARTISGVQEVFEIPLVRGTGVAIVADRFWAAKQARDRLRAEWDTASVERPDTAQLFAKYRERICR